MDTEKKEITTKLFQVSYLRKYIFVLEHEGHHFQLKNKQIIFTHH